MRVRVDWKYGLMFVATIMGVVVPLMVWRLDTPSHSLRLVVASQTSLAPAGDVAMTGLKLMVDGVEVDRPYLTVLELSNDGSRPVLGADFEEPISLLIGAHTKIIRAEISNKTPPELEPILSRAERQLRINPLLLNPSDQIVLSVITTGGEPEFTARARIARINSIKVEHRERKLPAGAGFAVRSVGAFGLALLYSACLFGAFQPQSEFRVRRSVLVLAALALAFAAVEVLKPLRPVFEGWRYVLFAVGLAVPAIVVGGLWGSVRKRRADAELPLAPSLR